MFTFQPHPTANAHLPLWWYRMIFGLYCRIGRLGFEGFFRSWWWLDWRQVTMSFWVLSQLVRECCLHEGFQNLALWMSVAGEYTNRRLIVANRQSVLHSKIVKIECLWISIGWDGKENRRPKVMIEGRGSTVIPIPRFGSCFHHGDETCKNKCSMNYKGMIWVWRNVRSVLAAVGWESFPHLCTKLSEAEDL